MLEQDVINNEDWIDKPDVMKSIGVQANSSFYNLIKNKGFPRPVKLGTASRWIRGEVEEWKAQQLAKRDAA